MSTFGLPDVEYDVPLVVNLKITTPEPPVALLPETLPPPPAPPPRPFVPPVEAVLLEPPFPPPPVPPLPPALLPS